MAEVYAAAEIRLWGETVGAVVELDNGRIVFEYDDDFARREIEISPLKLPTSRRGPQSFEELRESPAFAGLPGVIADALPDAFGNKVIRAWFAARGQTERAMSPVQKLLYVGDRALGALQFHPATELPMRPAEKDSLEIAELVRGARQIIEGRPEVAIPEIYRIGSSAGGMRPKAVVLYDPETKTIRSGHAEPTEGDVPCLLKFDGVGDGTGTDDLALPRPYNRVEAAYGMIARQAGLETTDIEILEHEGYAHLLIRRFDLEDGERIHQHSLGGLIHVDFNQPGASSYEEYMRAALALGMAGGAIEEAFRRAVFNVVAVNQDDHVKNLSFQLRRSGRWELSPAYDLTYAQGHGWTARHQMRLADKTENILMDDLLGLAKSFGIRKPRAHVDRIIEAVEMWPSFAERTGVPEEGVEAIAAAHRERRRQLLG